MPARRGWTQGAARAKPNGKEIKNAFAESLTGAIGKAKLHRGSLHGQAGAWRFRGKEPQGRMTEKIALGLIDTRGFAGLSYATDAMHKAAKIELVDQYFYGGGFAIAIVRGPLAAVRAAVEAGAGELEKYCAVVATHVISNIDPWIAELLLGRVAAPAAADPASAAGVVETLGVAAALEAAKQGLDAADVALTGFRGPGGGLMAVFFRGPVAEVRSAVDAAAAHAAGVSKVYGTTVIPAPHPALVEGFASGKAESGAFGAGALGVLETLGFVALFEAVDAALKAGDVAFGAWSAIGSGYNSIGFRGQVAAVRSALAAAEESARSAGKYIDSTLIPSPHPAAARAAGVA